MPSRVRQVVLVVDQLQPTLDQFRELFRAGAGDVDPAMAALGLTHEVLRVGRDTYLEICAPLDPDADTTATRFLRRGGGSGYMAVVEVPDADELRARLTASGYAVPFAQEHYGNELTQLHPREFGTLVEADEVRSGSDWHYPTLEGVESTEVTTGISAIDIAVDDPAVIAARWSELFAAPLATGATAVEFPDGGVIRFEHNSGGHHGVVAFDVVASDRDAAGTAHEIAGVTVRFT